MDDETGIPKYGYTESKVKIIGKIKGDFNKGEVKIREAHYEYMPPLYMKQVVHFEWYYPTEKGEKHLLFLNYDADDDCYKIVEVY